MKLHLPKGIRTALIACVCVATASTSWGSDAEATQKFTETGEQAITEAGVYEAQGDIDITITNLDTSKAVELRGTDGAEITYAIGGKDIYVSGPLTLGQGVSLTGATSGSQAKVYVQGTTLTVENGALLSTWDLQTSSTAASKIDVKGGTIVVNGTWSQNFENGSLLLGMQGGKATLTVAGQYDGDTLTNAGTFESLTSNLSMDNGAEATVSKGGIMNVRSLHLSGSTFNLQGGALHLGKLGGSGQGNFNQNEIYVDEAGGVVNMEYGTLGATAGWSTDVALTLGSTTKGNVLTIATNTYDTATDAYTTTGVTINLNGANTIQGEVDVTGNGTLTLGSGSEIKAGATLTLGSGASLSASGITLNGTLALTGSNKVTVGDTAWTYGADAMVNIGDAGAGYVTLNTSGDTFLTGYTGDVTIANGCLVVNDAQSFSSVTVNEGQTLVVQEDLTADVNLSGHGSSNRYGGIAFDAANKKINGTVTVDDKKTGEIIAWRNNASVDYDATISGLDVDGTLYINGAPGETGRNTALAAVTITNAVSGAGTVSLTQGTLNLNGGLTESVTLEVKGGTANINGTVADTASLKANGGNMVLSAGTYGAAITGTGKLTTKGAVTLNDSAGFTGTLSMEGSTTTLANNKTYTFAALNHVSGENKLVVGSNSTVTIGSSSAIATRQNAANNSPIFEVGANSTVTDYTRWMLNNANLQVKGSGVYKVDSIVLSSGSTQYAGNVTIDAGATLHVIGTNTDADSTKGSLMLSNWDHAGGNTITVNGKLILDSGISSRDGKGVINVNTGGTLQMNNGLIFTRWGSDDANYHGSSDEAINIGDGGTLLLGTKNLASQNGGAGVTNAESITTNLRNGATLGIVQKDGETSVTINDTLTFENSPTVKLQAGSGEKMILASATTGAGKLNATGGGTIELQNATLGAGTAYAVTPTTTRATSNTTLIFNTSTGTNGLTITAAGSDDAEISDTGVATNAMVTADANVTIAAGESITIGDGSTMKFSNAESKITVEDGTAIEFTKGSTLDLTNVTTLDTTGLDLAADATLKLGNDIYTINNGQGILLTGSLTLAEGVIIDMTGISNADFQYMGTIFTYTGDDYETALAGLNGLTVTLKLSDYTQNKAQLIVDGNKVHLIPEPTTATLSLLALAGLCARRRRK